MKPTEREQVDEEGLADAPGIHTLRLVWAEGSAPGYVFVSLELGRTLIGRNSIEGFELNGKVSAQHAALDLTASGVLYVNKLRSQNRTVMNGQLVTKQEVMNEQGVLKTGHALWVYEIEPAALASPLDPAGARTSVRMRLVDAHLRKIAPTDSTVLIVGETGTGKERVARAIHAMSKRAKGPFVAVNCGAIAPSMLEAELFGHARGAFTDARADRAGLLQQAHGGTLFLDEIADLSLAGQAALLRAIQEKLVRPLGGLEVPVDVRIVAATNRDLVAMVKEKTFREELLFRMPHTMTVPPLRKRLADLVPLVHEIWEGEFEELAPAFSPDALHELFTHSWPGNVRELEHRIGQLRALRDPDSQEPIAAHVVRRVLEQRPGEQVDSLPPSPAVVNLKRMDRSSLLALLRRQGTLNGTAQILGVDRQVLRRRMSELGITTEGFRDPKT